MAHRRGFVGARGTLDLLSVLRGLQGAGPYGVFLSLRVGFTPM